MNIEHTFVFKYYNRATRRSNAAEKHILDAVVRAVFFAVTPGDTAAKVIRTRVFFFLATKGGEANNVEDYPIH